MSSESRKQLTPRKNIRKQRMTGGWGWGVTTCTSETATSIKSNLRFHKVDRGGYFILLNALRD